MDMDNILSRCPFLHNLCETQGRAFAASIATNPLLPATNAPRPPLLEAQDLRATFLLFHGREGVVPLAAALPTAQASLAEPAVARSMSVVRRPRSRHPLAGAPLATMSLHGLPGDFGDFLRQLTSRNQRKPLNSSRGKAAASGSTGSQALQQPAGSTAYPQGSASGADPAGGACPLRKFLGPTLAGMVFNKAGHLQCPAPIIQARAVLAATPPVKNLRPQALPVKLLAVGVVSALVNVPCGMFREHTEKFSMQWIFAVHASIPFIALLRKAVIMPKLAIVCTIAAAIAGQAIGARLERQRLQQLAEKEQAAGLVRPVLAALPTLQPQVAGQFSRSVAPAFRSKLKVARGGAALRTAHSELQLPLESADWRMDSGLPGMGSFKQLLVTAY